MNFGDDGDDFRGVNSIKYNSIREGTGNMLEEDGTGTDTDTETETEQ